MKALDEKLAPKNTDNSMIPCSFHEALARVGKGPDPESQLSDCQHLEHKSMAQVNIYLLGHCIPHTGWFHLGVIQYTPKKY